MTASPLTSIFSTGGFIRGFEIIASLLFLLALIVSPTRMSAEPNKVLELDGNGSYVDFPPNVFSNLSQATIEVWAKWDSFRNYSRVLEFGAGWQSIALFNHEKISDLRFNVYPQFAKNDRALMYSIRATNALKSNDWVHLAAVTGPGGMKLYVNGQLAGEHTNAASFINIKTYQTNSLGRSLARGQDNQDFSGQIDELRIWKTRRTETQIQENMHRRLLGDESGLVALWNFDDGTARDAGPRRIRGKLTGNARIVTADAETDATLVSGERRPVVEAAPVAVAPPSPRPTLATTVPASIPPERDPAVWWIAGALVFIAVLLGFLVLMLRRCGVGKDKLLPMSASKSLTTSSVTSVDQEMKERALAQLTEFAKESLVQGLYSQRKELLDAQRRAQEELTQLESRLASAALPERVRAYEKRIAELETELESRSGEVRELTKATLLLLRQRLEEEKQLEGKRHFN